MSRPVRTCIGCRGQEKKVDLLRIVWQSRPEQLDTGAGRPVVDARQISPSRGAYLHRRAECLQLAIKRRAAGRALRVAGVDPVALATAVDPHLSPE